MKIKLIIFAISFYAFFINNAFSVKFTIKNNCPYTIWPASLSSKGPQISTGFELASGASKTLDDVPSHWSGRIWARYVCSYSQGKFSCSSGDCGSGRIECGGAGAIPPATLVEFTLFGDGGQDFYDISLVDGPVMVAPQKLGCTTISCPVDINKVCPRELAVVSAGGGGVIGCKSACSAFNPPQYCCTGEKCKPTKYSQIFKQCPQAYSYAYDDPSSLFTCKGQPNYVITFCP